MLVLWVFWLLGLVVGLIALCLAVIAGAFLVDALVARSRTFRYVTDASRLECWHISRGGSNVTVYDYAPYRKPLANSKKAFVVFPGILAKRNQIEPLMPALQEYDVYAFKYGGLRYDRRQFVREATYIIRELLDTYEEVVLDGISHGGLLVLYVLQALGERASDVKGVILHDMPDGHKATIPFNALPGFVGRLFLLRRPGGAVNRVLGWVLKLMLQLPKRENVQLPLPGYQMELVGSLMNSKQYYTWVQTCAEQNLSGHLFSMWYTEFGDIVRAGSEGLPYQALKRVDNVHYIFYVYRNGTVVQPETVYRVKEAVSHMRLWMIDGTHCGFTENYDHNRLTLEATLERMQ